MYGRMYVSSNIIMHIIIGVQYAHTHKLHSNELNQI